MSPDLETLKAELLELDHRLQLITHQQASGSDPAVPSQSAQLLLLKQKLNERLATLDNSAWQLLLLEWRYDFALLFDHVRLWMAQVDASFNTEPARRVEMQSSASRP